MPRANPLCQDQTCPECYPSGSLLFNDRLLRYGNMAVEALFGYRSNSKGHRKAFRNLAANMKALALLHEKAVMCQL